MVIAARRVYETGIAEHIDRAAHNRTSTTLVDPIRPSTTAPQGAFQRGHVAECDRDANRMTDQYRVGEGQVATAAYKHPAPIQVASNSGMQQARYRGATNVKPTASPPPIIGYKVINQ